VTLDYEGPGRNARAYTMVQNNINMVLTGEGFVALDPGATTQQIPVMVHDAGSGTTVLPLRHVAGGDDPVTTFVSCSAASVTVPDGAETMDVYSRLFRTPADFYNPNWAAGVSRTGAALLVPNTLANHEDLEAAEEVRFPDGDVRAVESIERGGLFITVRLDGPPLDPAVAGFPKRFELLP
jgi:hypothetical protein